MIDATCPFVKKIHRIVQSHSAEGREIVIIGNDGHPEVEGIKGWCSTPVTVIGEEAEAEAFLREPHPAICVVSQTTFNYKKFDKLVEIISKMRYDKLDILNTICSATEERQSEARQIAGQVDSMIVIGGSHSSNTQKAIRNMQERMCKYLPYTNTERFGYSAIAIQGLRRYYSRGIDPK